MPSPPSSTLAGSFPPRATMIVAVLAVSGCVLFPLPESEQPDRPTITRFDIEGTKAVSEDDLKKVLATQSSGRKWLVWPEPSYLEPDAFVNDRKRIVRYYQARGFYGAKVVSADTIPDGEGRVRVRVQVEEGAPVRVTRVEIVGMEECAEARALLGSNPMKPGVVFTEELYDTGREAILSALGSTGWAKATVSQEAQVDPTRNEAHVTYRVTSGQRYEFGSIFIAGTAQVPKARIRSEAEEAIEPGKTFDGSALTKAQARVFDLGVFGGVRIAPGPADEKKKTIPVVISVREAPFRTIRAGPGITIQADSHWQLEAIAGWQHRNWLGGLRKLSLDARVGYAWMPNPWRSTKEAVVGLVSADFTQPQLFTRYTDLNVRTEVEQGLDSAYDFTAERLRLGVPLRLGRTFSFVPSVNAELYEIRNRSTITSREGQALLIDTCPGRDPTLCLISYFEQRFAVDLRDDPINTTKGLYVSLSLQEGFSLLGAGSSYIRFLPEVRAFANLPLDTVFAARARVGMVKPLPGSSDVPIVAKFHSGGPNLMRGYYTRQLSPVAESSYCRTGESGLENCQLSYVPLGGSGLIDGSLELRFPVVGDLGGAAFLDFGAVRFAAQDVLDLTHLKYAAGLGIRYKTLFGPLRVDVAVRLPTPGTGQPGVQIVEVSGGRITDTNRVYRDGTVVSIHVSIGEAF